MEKFQRSVEEIAEVVKSAKDRKKSCSLLIGAGCSVSAKIETANGFVEIIKDRRRTAYDRAKSKTYLSCMAELNRDEQRDLIAEYVDKAKINWAHVGIALLIEKGYVDRVLTTNFDPLVSRACALLNEFPAVYDFAASQFVKSDRIAKKAVFHLHGQHTGFVLLNTPEEVGNHAKLMKPVFDDAGSGRVWIVVGYSGENDGVFDHLANVENFGNGLYWVCYRDDDPPSHVREKLLVEGKGTFYIKGCDADSFFIKLTQTLKIFPPELIGKPFHHLKNTFDRLTPFPLPGQEEGKDVTHHALKKVEEAIKRFDEEENEKKGLLLLADLILMSGDYRRVDEIRKKYDESPSPELGESLAWIYIMDGNDLSDQAKTKTGEEADRLFNEAYRKYEEVPKIKPNDHEALYNWGVALSDQAKTKEGKEADLLFGEAYRKYEEVLKIKPNKHEALYNWGVALSEQAETKGGKEAYLLFTQACEKYKEVLKIKPDDHEALYNLGNMLFDQAETKEGEEADRLFTQACEKYKEVLKIKPDDHDSLFNLVCLHALKGDSENCRKWLEKCIQYGPLKPEDLKDSDLNKVRDTDWFKKLISGGG